MKRDERIKNIDGKFSRTNQTTIIERVKCIKEILPDVKKIAELCCGDCRTQNEIYKNVLGIQNYIGIDLDARIIQFLKAHDVTCVQGDAMDPSILKKVLDFDLLFFGPPLSKDCMGHDFLKFEEIRPSYLDFLSLIYKDLKFTGSVVCICPKSTQMGEIQWLYKKLRKDGLNLNLRQIYLSISSMTGRGDLTEPRLKYIELWFSPNLQDKWEINPVNKEYLWS